MEQEQIISEIKKLCSSVTESHYDKTIHRGYHLLVMLHDSGLNQAEIYQSLFRFHNDQEEGIVCDFVADLLDFVVGWCSPQWDIWRNDTKFEQTK